MVNNVQAIYKDVRAETYQPKTAINMRPEH